MLRRPRSDVTVSRPSEEQQVVLDKYNDAKWLKVVRKTTRPLRRHSCISTILPTTRADHFCMHLVTWILTFTPRMVPTSASCPSAAYTHGLATQKAYRQSDYFPTLATYSSQPVWIVKSSFGKYTTIVGWYVHTQATARLYVTSHSTTMERGSSRHPMTAM